MKNYHEKFNDFYNSSEWKAIRNQKFIEARGLCERCEKRGIIKKGKEVHHKIPIEQRPDLRLDMNNLELLCSDCHNNAHGRESSLQKFNNFWEKLNNGEIAENGR